MWIRVTSGEDRRLRGTLITLLALCVPGPGRAQVPGPRLEEYRAPLGETVSFESRVFDEERHVFVGLPPGYDSSREYPLILVLEAEVLFEPIASMTALMADVQEIPPVIVVGIPTGGRELEFAPPSPGSAEPGGIDRTLAHYREELFPLLDSLYGVGDDRIIWGHSALGGTVCTYLLLGPDTQFTGILSSSPSLRFVQEWVEREDTFTELSGKDTTFYYLTFGDSEDEAYMGEMFQTVQRFRDRLLAEAPPNLDWEYRLYEGNTHFTNAIETYVDGLKLYFGSR
jgi:enterochelin esterase-like enzyme